MNWPSIQRVLTQNPLGHAAEIQIFHKHHPSVVAEVMGQFEMPVPTGIGNALMDSPNLLLELETSFAWP